MPDDRYEINHSGQIVKGDSALCANQSSILIALFSQYNHRCREVDHSGAYRKLELTDANEKTRTLHVYSGTVRNEARNPYEKKIQLGTTSNPKKTDKHDTLILGIYVYEPNDTIYDAIFVGYPVDDSIRYDTNPSLRGVFVNQLLVQAKNNGFVYDSARNTAAFRAEFIFYYLENHYDLHYKRSEIPEVSEVVNEKKTNNSIDRAENILLYGVPGCGKSYAIKTEYCDDDDYMERAVFHPDYTYSDFVGQILPRVDGGHIEYRFEPGPFTRILKRAAESPDEKYYLVIEEINRGNAPAIFGDIFQLLDRDKNGCSEYGVSNENISNYVYGNDTTKIKIPGNLFVLATMNTSDQNVFTLDTAFKRRWTMRMIENNIDACEYADHQICAWGITWGSFAKTINLKITELGENNLSNEDNRLGAYFVREEDLNDAERFGEKVLMYLWNDAFKFDHDKVFKAEYRTLDELITGFVRVGFAVFSDDIIFETIAEGTDDIVETDNPTAEQYLEGKNPELVAAYRTLFEAVTSRIPNAYDASVGSLTYAAWKANDIRKASFADIVIQRNRIVISCEVPASEATRAVGEQIPVDNHHNHYFRIIYDVTQTEQIVEAIVDSYNQLKVQ